MSESAKHCYVTSMGQARGPTATGASETNDSKRSRKASPRSFFFLENESTEHPLPTPHFTPMIQIVYKPARAGSRAQSVLGAPSIATRGYIQKYIAIGILRPAGAPEAKPMRIRSFRGAPPLQSSFLPLRLCLERLHRVLP